MELFKKLYRKEVKPDLDYFFLTGVVGLFTLLRIPSLFEPDWYGDEAIYQVIGKALLHGRLLYKGIWDNKPPLLYIYYALVNGDLFSIKLLSLIFGACAVVTFYLVALTLFQKSKSSVIVSTLFFAILFGLPLLEGNIANAENFMLFPILLSLLLIIKLTNKTKNIFPVLSGLLLSLSFLTKIVAVFDFTAFVIILFSIRFYNLNIIDIKKKLIKSPRKMIELVREEILLGVSFFIPIFLVCIFFIVTGAFPDFLRATFSQNIGYVGYANKFIVPQGFLIIKIILLCAGVLSALYFRKKIGPSALLIYIWLFFGLFDAFFSGRPYTHYVLVVLPAISLLLGLIFTERKLRVYHAGVFLFSVLLLWSQFNYYKKIEPYYKNYFDYVFSQKSTEQYQAFFDGSTPNVYDIARFISMNTNKEENIFLISNSAQIYYLSNKLPPGRYIVAYHLDFYKNAIEETHKALQNSQPKYIISSDKTLAQNFIWGYTLKYNIQNFYIYEKSF